MALLTSSGVGLGLPSINAAQLMTSPGVQKPHCTASCATNAACTGCSASPVAKPSMVVIFRPPTSTASSMHEATGTRSSHTVQAEHEPRSQPIFVPVNPSASRSASTSVVDGSTETSRSSPLTFKVIPAVPGPTTGEAVTLATAAAADCVPVAKPVSTAVVA